MLKLPRPGAPNFGISGRSSILQLAASSLLDVLSGTEVAVYLRLLAAAVNQGTNRVRVSNGELHRGRHPKNVSAALRRLAEHGLIRVRDAGLLTRTIEVER